MFAPRVPPAERLGRLRRAELYVDTFPYTGHTTMADALWAGVPGVPGVPGVACMGSGLASRVAGSLLYATGLPEPVTEDAGSLEKLALDLATDRERLAGVWSRLDANLSSASGFDAPRFSRQMAPAYGRMWALAREGRGPEGFEVAWQDVPGRGLRDRRFPREW